MKTLVENAKQFDSALAGKRIEELQKKSNSLVSDSKQKIQDTIQILLQIIFKNVTIKHGEIELEMYKENFVIRHITNREKSYAHRIEIKFLSEYDAKYSSDSKVEMYKNRNMKYGSVKSISFDGCGVNYESQTEPTKQVELFMEYFSLQTYLSKDLMIGGEFVSTMNLAYDDLRKIWDELDNIWSEGRELKLKIERDSKDNFEKQIRDNFDKYFKEGNHIVVRKISKDFVEASVYVIGKVQKTTFYNRHDAIEIESLSRFNDEKQLYALTARGYNRKEERKSIDTYISIWASALNNGDKIEVLSTEEWNKLVKDIDKERDKIRNGKLDDVSERYHSIKYKKED